MNKEFTASDRGLLRHPSPRRSRRRRKATPGPDASAIHGQLGAQVALLQSPILPAAVLNYHKYKNFHCYPVDKPHTRIIAAKEPCGRLRPHPHETSRAIRTSHSVFTRRGRGPSAHGQNFPRTATGPSVAAPSPPHTLTKVHKPIRSRTPLPPAADGDRPCADRSRMTRPASSGRLTILWPSITISL